MPFCQHPRLGVAVKFYSMFYVFTLIVCVLYTPFVTFSIPIYLPARIVLTWIPASEVLLLLFCSNSTVFFFWPTMSNLKIVSLNIKGINHVVKRQKLHYNLKKESCQIGFLQETHLSELEHIKLRSSWLGQVFYSSYNSSSHGLAILIHRSLAFKLDKEIKDKEGCYVLISGYIFGEHIIIRCVYAPTIYEPSFLSY